MNQINIRNEGIDLLEGEKFNEALSKFSGLIGILIIL